MIPCTLRQLEIFLAAAEDCHFVRTANRLGISQPAVTSHIRTLEEELGVELFVRRKGTTPILSEEGAALLNRARSFLAEGRRIQAMKSKIPEAEPNPIRICAGSHILDDAVRPRLSDFYKAHPTLILELQEARGATEGARRVHRGAADFFLHTVKDPAVFDLAYEGVCNVEVGVYGNHSFRRFRGTGAAELAGLPFILPLKGSPQDLFVQKALGDVGIICENVIARTQYHHVMLDMVRRGDGVAVLFDTMMPESAERNGIIRIDDHLPSMQRCMFYPRQPLPEAAKIAREFLRDALAA